MKTWLKRVMRKDCAMRLRRRLDPLAEREALSTIIEESKVDGEIFVCRWYRDCDGVESKTMIKLPARVMAYELFVQRESEWADGPMYFNVMSKEEVDGFQPYWRDTYAERAGY